MAADFKFTEELSKLCEEKHIDQLYLLDRLEKALADSYAKSLGLYFGAKVTIDRATAKIYVYELVPVEESYDEEKDEYTEFEEVDVTPRIPSRVAAQQAKNVINELVRTASRKQIYEEFKDRVGDIITGTVLQITKQFTIIKIREGVEAELPYFEARYDENGNRKNPDDRNERPRGERYSHNQRVKAIIVEVRDPEDTTKQLSGEHVRPSIVVSRTHPDLVRRLFELEVPEIYDGAVKINSIARDPGSRAKVAVSSIDDRLDPVGACVGPRGSRVRAVVSELRGERVDVVLWDEDPARRIANALSPAKVTRVLVDPDPEQRRATIIVPDDQLTLAIGKEGQNARLAARLTGMKIDIKSESLASAILKDLPKIEEPEEADVFEADEAHRCEYVAPSGEQCRNMARPGSHYCGVHAPLEQDTDAVSLV